jgi:hypothetical protein
MKITVSQLRKIIREEVQKNLTEALDSPDPQDVHDAFLKLRDPYGQYRVLLSDLARELGVKENQIDWNGTGLRVINGVVTELLGDTPYKNSP